MVQPVAAAPPAGHPLQYPWAWIRGMDRYRRIAAEAGARGLGNIELSRAVFLPLKRELEASIPLIDTTVYSPQARAEMDQFLGDVTEFNRRFIAQQPPPPDKPVSTRNYSQLREDCLGHIMRNGKKTEEGLLQAGLFRIDGDGDRIFDFRRTDRFEHGLRNYFVSASAKAAAAGPVVQVTAARRPPPLPIVIAGGLILGIIGVAAALGVWELFRPIHP